MGWIIAIVVGGLAGWIAEQIMKSEMGILANIGLGILGAFVAKLVLGLFGVYFSGALGSLIAGVAGACLLIFLSRQWKKREG